MKLVTNKHIPTQALGFYTNTTRPKPEPTSKTNQHARIKFAPAHGIRKFNERRWLHATLVELRLGEATLKGDV